MTNSAQLRDGVRSDNVGGTGSTSRPADKKRQISQAYKQYYAQLEDAVAKREDGQYLVGLEIVCLTGRMAGITAIKIPVEDFRERVPLKLISERVSDSFGYRVVIGPRLFESQMRAGRSFGGKFLVYRLDID